MVCRYGIYFAWMVALIATLVSLYYSEILGWAVCSLCWYQRICLYPLVILLGIGAYRDDRAIILYVLPQIIIGALIALYQILRMYLPVLKISGVCSQGVSCDKAYFELFGINILPVLSLVSFLLILVFLLLRKRAELKNL